MRAHVFEHHIGGCGSSSPAADEPLLHHSCHSQSRQRPSLPACTHVSSGDGLRNGRKAILKPLQGRHIAGWYFSLTGPKLPMIVDDVEEE